MSEIIAFLRSETEKREFLIEDFLKVNTKPGGAINAEELSGVVQNIHQVFSSIERLRAKHSKWTMMPSSKFFDSMKALISLNSLPESNVNIGLPKASSEATIVGYLYVFHVVQIHSHGLGHILQEEAKFDESVYRVFNSIQDNLAIRKIFLDKIKAEIRLTDKEELVKGINIAFREIEKRLSGKTAQ